MIEIGKYNTLKIAREVEFGVYLDGGDLGEILMPDKYVHYKQTVGDDVEAFIYFDSEDRIVATTEKPKATVGDFASLNVVSVTSVGAFLDWGLAKDLLVPFSEQRIKMEEGKSYVVYIYHDEKSNRIAATAKLDKRFKELPEDIEEGEAVNLLIYSKTDIGYKAIINNMATGLLFQDDVFQALSIGQQLDGFIKKRREDDKIDLMLQKTGYKKVEDFTDTVLHYLKEHNGTLHLTDKSSADDIYTLFSVSKKTFKKAIGALYKQRLILLEKEGIKLK